MTTTSAMSKRLSVAAIVLNSVSHDIRVCKEADGLGHAGFDVTIVGIRDRRESSPRTIRGPHVRIVRVDTPGWAVYRKYLGESRRSMLTACMTILLILLILGSSFGSMIDLLLANLAATFGIAGLAALPVLCYLAFRFARRARRFGRLATSKRMEFASSAPESTPSVGWWSAVKASIADTLRGVRWICVWIRRLGRFRSCIEAELDRIRPQFVHCHDLPALPVVVRWCRRNPGVRLVFDSHELYEEVSGLTPLTRWCCRRILRRHAGRVDGFITVNESIAREHAARYPALPPAVVVRNATRAPENPVVYDGRLHRAAGVDPDRRVLLYQGGFSKERGLESLVTAAGRLPADWVLVMMGWGTLESRLRSLVERDPGLPERVRFVPPAPQEELVAWTAGADFGVIPYENTCLNHWYCSPNKLWEYPAAGVPILATPFPEMRRVIEDHGIGRTLPEGFNGPELAGILESIDPAEHRRMVESCRAFIDADHWEIYQSRLDRLYAELRKDVRPD